MSAGSARKGKAVEHLVAASCVLASAGNLNAMTALVDDEGVDVTFKHRNGTKTLDVQIKARFNDQDGSKLLREKGQLQADIRKATFRPRPDLWMLFVVASASNAEFGPVWLVPSRAFSDEGLPIGEDHLRIHTAVSPESTSKWRQYRLERHELAPAVLAALAALEDEAPA